MKTSGHFDRKQDSEANFGQRDLFGVEWLLPASKSSRSKGQLGDGSFDFEHCSMSSSLSEKSPEIEARILSHRGVPVGAWVTPSDIVRSTKPDSHRMFAFCSLLVVATPRLIDPQCPLQYGIDPPTITVVHLPQRSDNAPRTHHARFNNVQPGIHKWSNPPHG